MRLRFRALLNYPGGVSRTRQDYAEKDAATLIGSPSLDTTAALIGYTWQDRGGPP